MLFRVVILAFLFSFNAFANPEIVVSIKPIHSIVSALTQGVMTPKLLFKTNQSPHHSHLKPSQLSLLSAADLVIIIHPKFETGLKKIVANINADKKFIINADATEQHSWLDINRMQIFAKKLTKKLIKIDKVNTDIYQKNLTQINRQLKQLKQNTKKQLANYKNRPIAAYSDAFKHFIQSNHLKKPIIVSKFHGDRLSIYKVRIAKNAIQKNQVKCLLSTATAPNKRLHVLTQGLGIKPVMIDIIGTQIPLNTQHYFTLMRNITSQVALCLK